MISTVFYKKKDKKIYSVAQGEQELTCLTSNKDELEVMEMLYDYGYMEFDKYVAMNYEKFDIVNIDENKNIIIVLKKEYEEELKTILNNFSIK